MLDPTVSGSVERYGKGIIHRRVAKGLETPKRSRSWNAFQFVEPFPVTRDDIIALGKDPNSVAQYPNKDSGLGEEAYIASLDILHKIHCDSGLRKMAFAEFRERSPKKKVQG